MWRCTVLVSTAAAGGPRERERPCASTRPIIEPPTHPCAACAYRRSDATDCMGEVTELTFRPAFWRGCERGAAVRVQTHPAMMG